MAQYVVKDKLIYSLAHKKYYEVLTRYPANSKDFCNGLMRRLPETWSLRRNEIWTHCNPPAPQFPDQGWKIHISATPAHASAILSTAAEILVRKNVAFKFVSDRMLLSLSLGKRWSRGGSGKFMAIYPRDEQQCAELLEELHQATIGFNGPYILSDRRYADSRVVYYRYGGLRSARRLSADGTKSLVIASQDGQYIDDERTPYFQLPPGIQDPFVKEISKEDDGEPGTLKNGRYKIESVQVFSNSGGVYLALDRHSGERVIIKEGRPFTNVSQRGLDAIQLLKKEHRVLSTVQDTGYAPRPVDFFFDWEHAYLVEEYFEKARDFRGYMNHLTVTLRTRPTQADSQLFIDRYCEVFRQLTRIIQDLHRRHIVFGDLSMGNVMITTLDDPAGEIKVQLIDFEGAHEADVDLPAHLYTPGFTPEEFHERGVSERDDDIFALGSLMLAALFPMNQLLGLDRTAHTRFLDAIARDFGLPPALHGIIAGLLSKRENRPALEQVSEVLNASYVMPQPAITTFEFDSVDLKQCLDRTMQYIDTTPDFSRTDRLFPADPEVFNSNPLSLAYGACGIALVQKKVRGQVAPEILQWIEAFPLRREAFPPGLYSGLSGIAWFWLEMGEEERAKRTLEIADGHPHLKAEPDVFNGLAGWGMTQLKFFRHFGDRRYLEAAIMAGEQLLATGEHVDPDQRFWTTSEGVSAGFAHGTAGIAAFLLYLYVASDRKEFMKAGEKGLAWVASRSVKNADDGATWLIRNDVPSATPYWRWGSSGIGRAVLRYWHVTGQESYAKLLDDILVDVDRKYAIFPGYFFGLAGIGELLLDMVRFDRWREQALRSLKRLFSGVMFYAMPDGDGIAFPGESLGRITCDFGTGSAGIALVWHRYLSRCGSTLMLDEILPGWKTEDE